MECAYYFVDGTWNVRTTLTFVGCFMVEFTEIEIGSDVFSQSLEIRLNVE